MVESNKITAYMSLDKETISDTQDDAAKRDIESMGENEEKESASWLYNDIGYHVDEFYFDENENKIEMNGDFFDDHTSKRLGYMSLSIPVTSEFLIELIESYRKKLAKLKAVMEAIK